LKNFTGTLAMMIIATLRNMAELLPDTPGPYPRMRIPADRRESVVKILPDLVLQSI
jgi:hypothetical protein